MSDQVNFSVIMPCYNSEAYLRTALESVVNQTWPNWEMIAIDDGSTDATQKILQEYAAADSRIRVYTKNNGGYVSAVNYGLDRIHGEYFLMMGSDDALDLELFKNIAEAMGINRPHCIAFRTEIIQNGENLGVESITNFPSGCEKFNTDIAEFSEEYPVQAEIFFTRDTSKCYHHSLLGDLRYFGRYGLDADGIFSMLLCHNADSFLVVPVTGYYWTKRDDSISGKKRSYQQQCDCVVNWTQFFKIVVERKYVLAHTEKQYLHYLIDLLQSVARNGKQTALIRDAALVIWDVSEMAHFNLDISKKNRLLLKFPAIWRLISRIFK